MMMLPLFYFRKRGLLMEYQLELKQIVDFPRCRIYRNFIRTLSSDKSIRTTGGSFLFWYLVLCSYANYSTSNRRIRSIETHDTAMQERKRKPRFFFCSAIKKKGRMIMKAIHPLTEEQRIFAEKHHDYIYQYLNGRHLCIEEYYDIAVFGYLLAVQEYLEKPALEKYSFISIARTAMRDAIATEWKKQNRPMRKAFLVEFQEDTAELDAFLPNRQERLAEALDDRNHLMALLAYLTPKERRMVLLKADGYTYREIAEKCNIPTQYVGKYFLHLRRKIRGLELTDAR